MPDSSLQKRFFWVAISVLALLGSIIFYSQNLVNQTARQSIQTVAEIRQLERRVNEIRSSLQILEQLIYQRTVISYKNDSNTAQQIDNQIAILKSQVNDFIVDSSFTSQWQSGNQDEQESFVELTARLEDSLQSLFQSINRYNEIISNVRLRFPSSRLIVEKLFPLSTDFFREVNLALDDVENTSPGSRNSYALNLLKELRYNWLQQVSQFRLFVANRSGMFNTPEEAMSMNLMNRELYVQEVDKLIRKLEDQAISNELPFQASISVDNIRGIYHDYEELFAEVKRYYMSDNWRIDHEFLHDRIQPEFKLAAGIIDDISNKIKIYATGTITRTQGVASTITMMIWLTGAALVVLIIVGYVVFERLIRHPIQMVADAINAEASGESFSPIINTRIRETGLLVDAFRNMQAQVHSRQARLESILSSAAEGVITMDENGVIESFNQAAEDLFGYRAEEITGEHFTRLFPAEILARRNSYVGRLAEGMIGVTDSEIETTGMHKEGSTFPMSLKVSEMEVAGKRLYTAMVDDVSERMTMISHLRHLAEHDSLTSLANRYFFLQELERVVQRASRGRHSDVALLYIDMDNFKYVNDTMGHMAGDKLLIEVSGMLKSRSRETDLVARIGGDEFAVILYDVDQEAALAAGESFRDKLQNYHFSYEGKLADVGCSIGVAMVEQNISKDELLARADLSCNAAKRAGRNRVRVYSDVDRQNLESISDDMGWVRRIKEAVRNDRFMFVLQPIMHTESREITRCEVLLRMLDDQGRFIMPSGFIPAAERFSLMPEIDRWVVEHAFEYLANDDNNAVTLAINLSAASFDNDEIINLITDKVARAGIDPTRLIFEITETVAMADLELTAAFMEKLRSLGCRTALDDFGVGYSSFAYLKDLPVDYVKIDGSFVRDIDSNELNKAIVKSMNDVAQAMGKLTVAEFVESKSGMEILELIGVDYLQGYHIGRPQVPEFEKRRITLNHNVVSLP